MLVVSSVAMAQAGAGKDNSLYNKLSKDDSSGGPAPRRDLSGTWTGPLEPKRGDAPPLTPVGQSGSVSTRPRQTSVGRTPMTHGRRAIHLDFPAARLTKQEGFRLRRCPAKLWYCTTTIESGATSGWTGATFPRT